MYTPERTYFLDEAKLRASERTEFGIPSLKKYPMPDRAHVKAAIRMFNHVDSAHEKELAAAIKRKMKEYNISPDTVGENNRLSKYVHEDTDILNEEFLVIDPNNPTKNMTMLQKMEYYITIKPADVLSKWLHKLNMWMAEIKDKYENKKPEERSLWDKVKNMIATLIEKISRKLYNWSTPYITHSIREYKPNDKNRSEAHTFNRSMKDMKDNLDDAIKKLPNEGPKAIRDFIDKYGKPKHESTQYNLENLHLVVTN